MFDDQKRLLVLTSSMCLHREQVQNQQRALTLLEAKNIPYNTLDGADASFKEQRNELFKISGVRGQYPQFFVISPDTIEFLGDWEHVEALNDASNLPDDILSQNPQIMTWNRLLSSI